MIKIIIAINKKAVVIIIMMTGGGDAVVPNNKVAWLIFLRVTEVLHVNLGKITGYHD
jgi:hypothetical protein